VAQHETARQLLAAEYSAARERLTQLEREFAGIVEASGVAGTDDEHDPEGATTAFERQHVAALAGQAQEHLAEIDAALRKLRDGRYELCDDCGRPIGTDRLTARPAALTCIRCAARG
jgi:DnaK suppressor protein